MIATDDVDFILFNIGIFAITIEEYIYFCKKQTTMKKPVLYLALAALLSFNSFAQEKAVPERVTVNLPGGKAPEAPDGPFVASWESLRENYSVPEWFKDAKFGIFMHWGVYSVPAAGSEWYPKHMYNGMATAHAEKWGEQDKFGYKDFIPMFKAEKFDPDAWAELFVEAGAKYVIPTAEHHDGFALYDCSYSEWDAVDKGPHRDLIGDLSKAVRAKGLKFGVSNHRIENWDFMYPEKLQKHDLYDSQYATLYGPPQKPVAASGMGPAEGQTDRHPQSDAFLEEWLARAEEIVDRYQPDLFYFDNGVNYRSLDPWKLRFAEYYYNSAAKWGKDVSIQTKSSAYLYGTVKDYERQSRAPKSFSEPYWQVDDPIGHKFGYVEGLQLQNADNIIRSLVHNIARNGNLCLNISPKADGTIPDDQQAVLREVGAWLRIYGDAVYGTRAWKLCNEGDDWNFTCKGDNTVYAFAMHWDGSEAAIDALGSRFAGKITSVELLGKDKVKFEQNADRLVIKTKTDEKHIPVFKVTLAKRAKVACIGDSITFGYGLKSPLTDSYPAVLQNLLGEKYEVRNYGFSARTMSQSGDRPYMKETMYEQAKAFLPDVAVVMLGTNDVKPENWNEKDFEESCNLMISELKALPSHPEIFICHPATVHGDRWGIKDSTIVAGAMPVIKRVAFRHGLEIIDIHKATAAYANHFPDFIHPDTEASEAIAEAVCNVLAENGWSRNPGKKIVFAGDSITDGGWGNANGKPSSIRNHYDYNHIYGHGYAADVASIYLEKFPQNNYRFYNRGKSGDTLSDLEKRWKDDVMALNPDVISIFIGINDTLGDTSYGDFDFAGWEKRYRSLIENTLSANGNCRMVLCTPFFSKNGRFGNIDNFSNKSRIVNRLASIVTALAGEYRLTLVDFAGLVENAIANDKSGDVNYWVWDGIHPTYQTHLRMTRLWIKKVGKI